MPDNMAAAAIALAFSAGGVAKLPDDRAYD
jgi:hypothetical protein